MAQVWPSSCETKTWKALPAAPSSIDGRWDHVGVWTGTDLLVFGGYGGTDIANLAKKTGARMVPGAPGQGQPGPLDTTTTGQYL